MKRLSIMPGIVKKLSVQKGRDEPIDANGSHGEEACLREL